MITPRQTRLVRVPDLQAFRRAIAALAAVPSESARPCLVVVPTRGAARALQSAVANSVVDLLTREELYDRLAERLPGCPRQLTPFERDSLMQAAAAAAANGEPSLPFRVRPGLVAEILRFYDQLRRQSQRVGRFEELMEEKLGPSASGGDRGAERMWQQTRFLAAAFRGYEQRSAESGAGDEHTLRERLVDYSTDLGIGHVVITVADWIADPAGLFVADFDLLARLPGLDKLDVVATEGTLASGFHERLRGWLPELDEVDASAVVAAGLPTRPYLIVPGPPDGTPDRPWFTHRDRAEELVAVARRAAAGQRTMPGRSLDRIAVASKRPLPYLYLAPDAFSPLGIPYQSSDAMPLASEPTAAALDLVLDFVESGFTRDATVALLRTPHLSLGLEPGESLESIAALNRALSEHRYLGELTRLEALLVVWDVSDPPPLIAQALRALKTAIVVARELAPLLTPDRASRQLERLRMFMTSRARLLSHDDPFASRERRARAAVADTLDRLAAAHAAHHDPDWTIEQLAGAVRRWIGEQTFTHEGTDSGLHLVDDQAVRYRDFDDLTVVGLVENEWPERPQGNIFYPTSLLKSLGWPSEKDRRSAEDARFLDLVRSSSRHVVLSTFVLEEELLVSRSMQLDDVLRAGLSTVADDSDSSSHVFPDDALVAEPSSLGGLDAGARNWAELRSARPPSDKPDFHGAVGSRPPRPWSVSALETYLTCPFKFFAEHVLQLTEEPDDEEMMDPRRQGLLVHKVFEEFFRAWQAGGRGRVSTDNLDSARAMFVEVVDRMLDGMPEAEAALERTRLLGSPAATGLGEAVLRMEAERPTAVVERLLEHRINGDIAISTESGSRAIALRGKVDRIDLLEDGTFRLIDYKLGWPPNRGHALQLPIYGLAAEQRLAGYRNRRWTLGEAAYLAFKGPKRVVPLVSSSADRVRVLAEAQERLAHVVDAIERGEFQPSPDDIFRCETCSFLSVCRKDYVDAP